MSLPKIKFKLVTPERTLYDDEVDQATLPVVDGEVTILPNHISYIASLKAGEAVLKIGKEEKSLAVSGGFIEFDKNNLTVLADTAEYAEEIDLQKAEVAKANAEKLKEKKISMDEMEYAKVAAAIERESARIKISRKHHSKRGAMIN